MNYKIGPRRAGDVEKIYSDNTLSSNQLQWKAKKTLEDAMKSAWKWEQQKVNKNVQKECRYCFRQRILL